MATQDIIKKILALKPNLTEEGVQQQQRYLRDLLAEATIDRPRRPRVNARVVKIKMSKFKRKKKHHQTQIRSLEKELEIIAPAAA